MPALMDMIGSGLSILVVMGVAFQVFIKITGNITQDYIRKTVKKIQSIDQIVTSYFIDKNTLKSKEYLIF